MFYLFSSIAVVFLFFSCGSVSSAEDENIRSKEVFVLQSRWHTALILRTDDIDSVDWPEIERYRDRVWVDIGWGDEMFYQASGSPVHLAARAILWPTQSVLQVYAFSNPIRSAYGEKARIMKIPVSEKELTALIRFVAASYQRDDNGNAQPSTAYGESRHFFLATRKYHLFRTCNTWVAMAFRDAGFRVRTFCVLNANQLFRQLSRIPDTEYE